MKDSLNLMFGQHWGNKLGRELFNTLVQGRLLPLFMAVWLQKDIILLSTLLYENQKIMIQFFFIWKP